MIPIPWDHTSQLSLGTVSLVTEISCFSVLYMLYMSFGHTGMVSVQVCSGWGHFVPRRNALEHFSGLYEPSLESLQEFLTLVCLEMVKSDHHLGVRLSTGNLEAVSCIHFHHSHFVSPLYKPLNLLLLMSH